MYIKITEDKAVKTDMTEDYFDKIHQPYRDWNTYLLTRPTFDIPESMKSLPVGSELNVREQYEVYKTHFTNDGWNVCDKERYDLELPEARRIILVPCEQGENDNEWRKYIRAAAVKYLQLPTHKQVVVWRKLGYENQSNNKETFHKQNQAFMKWVKESNNVKEFVSYFNLVPISHPSQEAPEQGEAELDAMTKEKDYWYNRCYQAEKFIEESPCDPDITREQIAAHKEWIKSKER